MRRNPSLMDVLGSDPTLRLVAATLGLAAAGALERLWPFRAQAGGVREVRHLALWAIAALLIQAIPFVAGVAAAEFARRSGIGLFNLLSLPAMVTVPLAVLVLDAWTYGLHRAYHTTPLLWRLHRVHHCDAALTTTTGVRFHPGEVLVSALTRVPVILVLGLPPAGAVAFEVALLLASQLQHSDVCLPERWARGFGRVFITPNLHRTHHSARRAEADTNFGTIFSLWDLGFGTFHRVDPSLVTVGAPEAVSLPADASLWALLALPLATPSEARRR